MIDWKKYDVNNPPELGKDYLVYDGRCIDIVFIDNLFEDEIEWVPNGVSSVYPEKVTHYAELYPPIISEEGE